MAGKIKHYQKDDITVLWQPDLCIHSKKCWHGLPEVFNPEQRPWINLDGAEDQAILKQVRACPSGALSLENETNQVQHSDAVNVTVTKAGPLLVAGDLDIKLASGEQVQKKGVTALCRCGASNNKPFCDGSHSSIDFDA